MYTAELGTDAVEAVKLCDIEPAVRYGPITFRNQVLYLSLNSTFSFYLITQPETIREICIHINDTIPDQDKRQGINSHETCADACATEDNCKVWTFDTQEKLCVLRYFIFFLSVLLGSFDTLKIIHVLDYCIVLSQYLVL